MRKSKKILSMLLGTMMIASLFTGCGKTNTENTTTIALNKDKAVNTSLSSKDYKVVGADPESIYDVQVIDNEGTIILAGQFIDIPTFEYYREAFVQESTKEKISGEKINGIDYTFIAQGDSVQNYCILGEISDEDAIMIYSAMDLDKNKEVLEELSLDVKELKD